MEPTTKLSSANIGIRAGALRARFDALLKDMKKRDKSVRLSDLLRDGLTAFWPQIEAYLRTRQQLRICPLELTKVTLIAAKALENGVTAEQIEEILAERMEGALTPQ